MPYTPPSFGGGVTDKLSIHADGHVEIDGKKVGWVENLEIHEIRRSRVSRTGRYEELEIAFRIVAMPEKPEPDAVYDMGGRVVGYLGTDGVTVSRVRTPDV